MINLSQYFNSFWLTASETKEMFASGADTQIQNADAGFHYFLLFILKSLGRACKLFHFRDLNRS